MKALFTIVSFSIFSISLLAQPTWEYYANDYWIQDVKVIDDQVFIGNPTGLHVIDMESKDSKLYQSVNSELRGSFVWEMLSKDNYIWIALNEGGIARYTLGENGLDGSWEQFYTPIAGDSDTLYRARNLIETKDGTLWFDQAWDGRGWLSSLKNGILTDHSIIFTEQPFNFSCHGNKRMYYRDSGSPLNYVDLDTQNKVQIPLPSADMSVVSYAALNDELYVTLSDSMGFYIYKYDNNDSWQKIDDLEESLYMNNPVRGTESIWLNYNEEDPVFSRISSDGHQKYTLTDIAGTQIESGYRTQILYEDEAGRIWLTSFRADRAETIVYSILDEELKEYDVTHSPLKPSYFQKGDVDFDCNGNFLSTSLINIHAFNPDSLIVIDVLENREFGDLEMIASDPITCKYYVAHDRNNADTSYIYVLENNEIIDTLLLNDGWIGGIIINSKRQLITSTYKDGIGIYDIDTEEWTWNREPLYDPVLNRYNGVWGMKEHVNGSITFGTWSSLVVYDNSIWTTYNVTNSPIGDESVFTHIIDSKGDILVEYQGGIYKYDGVEWEYTSFFDPYENAIMCIHEDENGNYWLGTYDSGLLYWNGFSYLQYDIMNSAIPSNKITGILQHPITDDLWLIADRGIAIFDRDRIAYKKGFFGKSYYDAKKNATYDPGDDIGLSDILIDINNETSVLTDVNGNYSFYPDNENFVEIECIIPIDFEATSSSTINQEFDGQDVFDVNFGLWKQLEEADLEVDLSLSPFICSSEISSWLTIENPSWNTIDGKATLILPNDIQILSTFPEADIVSGNTVSWNFEDLSFSEQRSFFAIIQGPTINELISQIDIDNNPLNEVDIDISASLEYNGITKDYTENVPFLCAYDPNDKLAVSAGPSVGDCSLLDDDLIYTIRFQNEGNYKATNVIITDTLSSLLDISTLEIMSSSHLVQTQINRENELIFRFIDIDLPSKSENEARSQGYVKFKISPIQNLPDNSIVLNTASIYFDSNSPIQTNTIKNILVEELPEAKEDGTENPKLQIYVSPNPSLGDFELTSNHQFFSYKVYDIQGREILSGVTGNGSAIFNLHIPGIYFVVVNGHNEINTIKIVKI